MAIAIKEMRIRGAPAIGAAAAMGMALAAIKAPKTTRSAFLEYLENAKHTLDSTRPTAVNLFWATNRMLNLAKSSQIPLKKLVPRLVDEANSIADDDVKVNKLIGKNGAHLIANGDGILTHCNAGAIATVGYGTALGIIRAAFEEGKQFTVYADETRPRLQGSRLTCWELAEDNIDVVHITDNQAGLLMQLGKVQCVILGADRIVHDAIFNKIGTYSVAIIASYHNVPFYVAAPVSTMDFELSMADVKIEQLDQSEVKKVLDKVMISPENIPALNYAFDPTPMNLITGIITEDGVFTPEKLVKHYPFNS